MLGAFEHFLVGEVFEIRYEQFAEGARPAERTPAFRRGDVLEPERAGSPAAGLVIEQLERRHRSGAAVLQIAACELLSDLEALFADRLLDFPEVARDLYAVAVCQLHVDAMLKRGEPPADLLDCLLPDGREFTLERGPLNLREGPIEDQREMGMRVPTVTAERDFYSPNGAQMPEALRKRFPAPPASDAAPGFEQVIEVEGEGIGGGMAQGEGDEGDPVAAFVCAFEGEGDFACACGADDGGADGACPDGAAAFEAGEVRAVVTRGGVEADDLGDAPAAACGAWGAYPVGAVSRVAGEVEGFTSGADQPARGALTTQEPDEPPVLGIRFGRNVRYVPRAPPFGGRFRARNGYTRHVSPPARKLGKTPNAEPLQRLGVHHFQRSLGPTMRIWR